MLSNCGWPNIQFCWIPKHGKRRPGKPNLTYWCVEARYRTSDIEFSDSHGGQKAMKIHHSSRTQLETSTLVTLKPFFSWHLHSALQRTQRFRTADTVHIRQCNYVAVANQRQLWHSNTKNRTHGLGNRCSLMISLRNFQTNQGYSGILILTKRQDATN